MVITGDLHAGHKTSCKTQLLGQRGIGTQVDEQTHRTELEAQGRHMCTGVGFITKGALPGAGEMVVSSTNGVG